MDLVPPDDSVECSGQIESRGSVTGSEEPTISESMLQCVSETVLCALNVFLYMHVYMWVDHLCAVSESMLQCVWGYFCVHTVHVCVSMGVQWLLCFHALERSVRKYPCTQRI